MDADSRLSVLESIVARFDTALVRLVDIVGELKVISSNHTSSFMHHDEKISMLRQALAEHVETDNARFDELRKALDKQTEIITSRISALETFKWKIVGAVILASCVSGAIGFAIELFLKLSFFYVKP